MRNKPQSLLDAEKAVNDAQEALKAEKERIRKECEDRYIARGRSALGKFYKTEYDINSCVQYSHYNEGENQCFDVYLEEKYSSAFYTCTRDLEEIGSVLDNPKTVEITEEEFLNALFAVVEKNLGKYGESIRLHQRD